MVNKRRWLAAYSLAEIIKIFCKRWNLRGPERTHVVDCLSLSDTRLIALPPLGCLKSLKGCQCLALPYMLIQPGLSCGSDPSPAPDKDHASQQIPLHLERVEAGHVLRWIDPAQHDVF